MFPSQDPIADSVMLLRSSHDRIVEARAWCEEMHQAYSSSIEAIQKSHELIAECDEAICSYGPLGSSAPPAVRESFMAKPARRS
jgi:hypothetical protein